MVGPVKALMVVVLLRPVAAALLMVTSANEPVQISHCPSSNANADELNANVKARRLVLIFDIFIDIFSVLFLID